MTAIILATIGPLLPDREQELGIKDLMFEVHCGRDTGQRLVEMGNEKARLSANQGAS